MMAEEGASSSSNSYDEHIDDRRDSQATTYTSSFTSHAPNENCSSVSSSNHMTCVSQGMISHTRSYNPFAIKMSIPTRSVADSTENKESRPLVAPPTLKLGNSDSSSNSVSSPPKIVLRPSALTAQAEKLKLMNKHETGSKADGKENYFQDAISKVAHSTNFEANGKILKTDLFVPGITTSVADSSVLSSASANTSGKLETMKNLGCSSEESLKKSVGFVFGQNLHERALNYDASAEQPLSPVESCNLSFEEAALKKEELEKLEQEEQEKLKKSLSESAKEYESKQVKRKFDEVTVITGEEEESNVLQMNCKLFSFNKVKMIWQERGRGILRLNDREYDGVLHSRVVMRTQGSLRVVLNTKVWAGMTVEHPSPKTVRLTAIDSEGIKVFLVMANPKDTEQLFNALDWRVATLKSQEEIFTKNGEKRTALDLAESPGLPDSSSSEQYSNSPNKRPRISEQHEGDADSSTEADFISRVINDTSSDSLVDSTDTGNNLSCYSDLGEPTELHD